MKDVRLPKGASVTMSRDDVRSMSGGGSWGWGVLALVIVGIALGNSGTDDKPNKPADKPSDRPSVSRTVDARN